MISAIAIKVEELEQVKMDETIYLLTPLQCAEHGERLALLLAPAAGLSDGEFTASDLVAAGIAGKLSILVDNLSAPKSVLVADVGCSFRKRWLDILAVAGRVWPFWLNAEIVKMWARGLGCTEIRMECKSESRKRLFKRYGFVPLRQRMYMEV